MVDGDHHLSDATAKAHCDGLRIFLRLRVATPTDPCGRTIRRRQALRKDERSGDHSVNQRDEPPNTASIYRRDRCGLHAASRT